MEELISLTNTIIKDEKIDIMNIFSINPYDPLLNKMDLLTICYDKRKSKLIMDKLRKHHGLTKLKKNPNKQSFINAKIHTPLSKTIKELLDESEKELVFPNEHKKIILEEIKKEPMISKELRRQLWLHASGARTKMIQNPDYFEKLVNLFDDYPDYFLKIIELDLKRTFIERDYDPCDPSIVKLRTILHSYAKRNPVIGYCQGLNFLIGQMIEIIADEQEAFWILTALIEDFLPADFFSTMHGVLVYQRILNDSIKILYPDIHKKFQELGDIDTSIFTLQWFVCLYSRTLPQSLYQIVWDMLFLEGPYVLIKVGLALIESLRERLLELTEFYNLFNVIEEGIKSLSSPKELIKLINKIYINKDMMHFIKEIYSQLISEEKGKLVEKSRFTQISKMIEKCSVIEIRCNKAWPICLHSIEEYCKEKRKQNIFIFRVLEYPKQIMDYFSEQYNDRNHHHYKDQKFRRLLSRKSTIKSSANIARTTIVSNNMITSTSKPISDNNNTTVAITATELSSANNAAITTLESSQLSNNTTLTSLLPTTNILLESKKLPDQYSLHDKRLPYRKYSNISKQYFDNILSLQNKMRMGRLDHLCRKLSESPNHRSDSILPTSQLEEQAKIYKEEYIGNALMTFSRCSISNIKQKVNRDRTPSPKIMVNQKNKLFSGGLILNSKAIEFKKEMKEIERTNSNKMNEISNINEKDKNGINDISKNVESLKEENKENKKKKKVEKDPLIGLNPNFGDYEIITRSSITSSPDQIPKSITQKQIITENGLQNNQAELLQSLPKTTESIIENEKQANFKPNENKTQIVKKSKEEREKIDDQKSRSFQKKFANFLKQ